MFCSCSSIQYFSDPSYSPMLGNILSTLKNNKPQSQKLLNNQKIKKKKHDQKQQNETEVCKNTIEFVFGQLLLGMRPPEVWLMQLLRLYWRKLSFLLPVGIKWR